VPSAEVETFLDIGGRLGVPSVERKERILKGKVAQPESQRMRTAHNGRFSRSVIQFSFKSIYNECIIWDMKNKRKSIFDESLISPGFDEVPGVAIFKGSGKARVFKVATAKIVNVYHTRGTQWREQPKSIKGGVVTFAKPPQKGNKIIVLYTS
jgi:hypothetical protein